MLAHTPQSEDPATQIAHPHIPLLDRHHISEVVIEVVPTAITNFFLHMFAPNSYLQCTATGQWSEPATHTPPEALERKNTVIVDDDFVLVGDSAESDGGPLCREAMIEKWKGEEHEVRTEDVEEKGEKKERRRSVQWLGNVIKREFSHSGGVVE